MAKEQEEAIKVLEQYKHECIEEYKAELDDKKYTDEQHASYLHQQIEAVHIVLSMLKEKDAELEKKEKMINKMIDEIMIHYQVKTMRKMCCPACKIGERACTYSGIHRNCIKQYFERKATNNG